MDRTFGAIGSLLGFLAVALGAFGAHGLRGRLTPEDLDVFETAVRYQMYHALAILFVALLLGREAGGAFGAGAGASVAGGGGPDGTPLAAWAGWAFTAGTLVFSGSLYLLVTTGPRWLGAITPIGGVGLLVGWILLLMAALRG